MKKTLWSFVLAVALSAGALAASPLSDAAPACLPPAGEAADAALPVFASGGFLPPWGEGCPRPGNCPLNYEPVICSNGQVYDNACMADLDCATGCVPYAMEV